MALDMNHVPDGADDNINAAPETVSAEGGETRITLGDVKKALRTLLECESINDEASREAQERIQQVASVAGLYRTAAEVYGFLSGNAYLGGDEERQYKSRGYELAGELYFLSLQREIDSVEDQQQPLGPSVFKGYCDELFDCFFHGENIRKGIGFPIMLVEHLIRKAATSFGHMPLYLELGEQALQSAMDLASRKYERDKQEERRASRLHKKGETPPPEKKSRHRVLDEEILQHLRTIGEQYAKLRGLFLKVTPVDVQNGQASPQDRLRVLREMLAAAETVGYLGVTGLLKAMLGSMITKAQPNQARAFLFAAARDYETLADREYELYLIKMASRRYRRAHKLYTMTQSEPEAARVNKKILEAKAAYDEFLLSVAQL